MSIETETQNNELLEPTTKGIRLDPNNLHSQVEDIMKEMINSMFEQKGDKLYYKGYHSTNPDEPEEFNDFRSLVNVNINVNLTPEIIEKGKSLCRGYNFKSNEDSTIASYILININRAGKYIKQLKNSNCIVDLSTRPIRIFIPKDRMNDKSLGQIAFEVYHSCNVMEHLEKSIADPKWINVDSELRALIEKVINNFHTWTGTTIPSDMTNYSQIRYIG